MLCCNLCFCHGGGTTVSGAHFPPAALLVLARRTNTNTTGWVPLQALICFTNTVFYFPPPGGSNINSERNRLVFSNLSIPTCLSHFPRRHQHQQRAQPAGRAVRRASGHARPPDRPPGELGAGIQAAAHPHAGALGVLCCALLCCAVEQLSTAGTRWTRSRCSVAARFSALSSKCIPAGAGRGGQIHVLDQMYWREASAGDLAALVLISTTSHLVPSLAGAGRGGPAAGDGLPPRHRARAE